MSTFSIFFLVFFGSAFLLLAVIAATRLPAMFSTLKKSIRLIIARRRRELQFTTDTEGMERAAHEMEDVYHFNED